MMKSGTVISCPGCMDEQLKTTKDAVPGGQMKDLCFESLGYDMENGLRMGCNKCGAMWYREHPKTKVPQLHTKDDGWVSYRGNKVIIK